MRSGRLTLCCAAAVWVAASAFQERPAPSTEANAARQRATYAVYAKAVSGSGPAVPFAIDQTILTESSGYGPPNRPQANPQPSCLQRTGQEPRFDEMLADYTARKNAAATLTRELTLSRDYVLLSSDGLESYLNSVAKNNPPGQDPAVPATVVRFSGVFFDRNLTTALTFISVMTYDATSKWSMSGAGGWRIFEKTDGGEWRAVEGSPGRCGPGWGIGSGQ